MSNNEGAGADIEPLTRDARPVFVVQSPWEGLVAVYKEPADLVSICGGIACEARERWLYRQFWEEGKRKMPDIDDPNQLIRYGYQCAGELGESCLKQLVQYDRLGHEIQRLENPSA